MAGGVETKGQGREGEELSDREGVEKVKRSERGGERGGGKMWGRCGEDKGKVGREGTRGEDEGGEGENGGRRVARGVKCG